MLCHKFPAVDQLRAVHLCLLEQFDDEGKPVRNQFLHFQADDGQGQHGALELKELVAGQAVQQLLGEQSHMLGRVHLG